MNILLPNEYQRFRLEALKETTKTRGKYSLEPIARAPARWSSTGAVKFPFYSPGGKEFGFDSVGVGRARERGPPRLMSFSARLPAPRSPNQARTKPVPSPNFSQMAPPRHTHEHLFPGGASPFT